MLLDAARELLQENAGSTPTLTEVARHAGMSRQAAYTNFGDFHGFLLALVVDALHLSELFTITDGHIAQDATGLQGQQVHPRLELEQTISKIQADPALLIALAKLEPRNSLYEVLAEFSRIVLVDAGWQPPSGDAPAGEDDFEFAIGGIHAALEGWMRSPRDRTPAMFIDEISRRLHKLGWTLPQPQ